MRILCCARPAYGHIHPLLPLAAAARRAGHHVTFATSGPFVARLGVLGFETFDVGLTIEAGRDLMLGGQTMPRDADGRPDFAAIARLFGEVLAPATANDMIPVLRREQPDVIVYEQYDLGAAIVARSLGIPIVLQAVSPRPDHPWLDVLSGHLDRLRVTLGVASPSIDATVGDLYLDPFPTVLQTVATRDLPQRVPVRPRPYADPTAAPIGSVRRDRPLVYLTLGTIVATDDALRPAIAALAGLDADVLVALGSASGEELGRLPDHVRVVDFVDQRRVLDQADLAVHHGGSGTLLAALIAGVPQMILPQGTDQFLNADRVVAAELAPVLEPKDVSVAAIRDVATATLGRLPVAAARARRELRIRPSPAGVIERLVRLVGGDDQAA